MNKVVFPYHRALRRILIRKTLIPISLFGLCLMVVTPFLLLFVQEDKLKKDNAVIAYQMEEAIQSYVSGIKDISKDPDIIYFVEHHDQSIKAYEKLYSFRNSQTLYGNFILIDVDGEILAGHEIKTIGNRLSIEYKHGHAKGVTDQLTSLLSSNQGDISFSLSTPIIKNEEVIGYLAFSFFQDEFQQKFLRQFKNYVIVDQYNRIITSDSKLGMPLDKFSLDYKWGTMAEFDQHLYLTQTETLDTFSIKIYSLLSLDSIKALFGIELGVFLIILVFMMVFLQRVSLDTAITSLEAVDDLFISLHNYSIHQTLEPISTKNKEMKPFVDQYNEIIKKVDELIQNNTQLQNRTKSSEIKLLQSQFNPHFLFNTLEAIKYMIVIDCDKASDMIFKLGRLLRYSLDTTNNSFVDLQKDLQYTEDYLLLQKLRLGDSFTYQIHVGVSTNIRIPKLIMQPLIENSIKHGYVQNKEFKLIITIDKIDSDLCIVVEDNGKGVSNSKIEEIKKSMNDKHEDGNHLGLVNTHRRIQLLFGNDYGLDIFSKEKIGTIITLKMIIQEDE